MLLLKIILSNLIRLQNMLMQEYNKTLVLVWTSCDIDMTELEHLCLKHYILCYLNFK